MPHGTVPSYPPTSAFVTPLGKGRAVWYLDGLMQIKAPAAATGGQIGVAEHLLPQGSSPPLHVHHGNDEAWYVLEGTVTYRVGEQILRAEAGSFVWAPRDIPHSLRVDSLTARFLTFYLPGGFEEFFLTIGQPAAKLTLPPPDGRPDLSGLAGVSRTYGCDVLGPPLS